MQPKSFYIHTIGCQMNVSDSERIALGLAPLGYVPALSPEAADLVIVNTCSVRAKAEQKAFSIIGQLAAAKARRPDMVVAVAGCVAQRKASASACGRRMWTSCSGPMPSTAWMACCSGWPPGAARSWISR